MTNLHTRITTPIVRTHNTLRTPQSSRMLLLHQHQRQALPWSLPLVPCGWNHSVSWYPASGVCLCNAVTSPPLRQVCFFLLPRVLLHRCTQLFICSWAHDGHFGHFRVADTLPFWPQTLTLTLVHFGLQGSHLNVCCHHQDLHLQQLIFFFFWKVAWFYWLLVQCWRTLKFYFKPIQAQQMTYSWI